MAQADALDTMLEEIGRQLDIVFELPARRRVGRAAPAAPRHRGGPDRRHPDVIAQRLATYHQLTEPLVGHYRGKGNLVGIHAGRTINEVFAEIQDALEQVAA